MGTAMGWSAPRPRGDTARLYDRLAWLALALLAALVAATFQDYGISNDEEVQHIYGEKLLAFYLSGFADMSAFDYKNLFLYGGLFDIVAAALAAIVPLDAYDLRHLLSGLIGVLGIAGAWRLGRRLAGPRTGLLALALLALTAPWYGAMFNHTKDIPFAVAMLWTVHFACKAAQELPRPGWLTVLGLGIALGAGLGLRVGALISGVYLAAVLALWLAASRRRSPQAILRDLATIAIRLTPALAIAYGLMAFAWPWSVFTPLNPLYALEAFSRFTYEVSTLFDGEVLKMYEVPAIYIPVYLAIKLPFSVLAGFAIAAGFAGSWMLRRHDLPDWWNNRGLIIVALAALVPVIYFVITVPPAYTGIRHFLFVVPPIAVLAAIGYDRLLIALAATGWRPRAALVSALGIAAAQQAAEMAALHPLEYVSYNAFVGGLKGARGKWATDYWANTVPEAIAALADHVEGEFRSGAIPRQRYLVAACVEPISVRAHLPPYLEYTPDWEAAHFFISPTHIGCDRLVRGHVLAEVKRLDTVLAVVKDRRALVPVPRVADLPRPSPSRPAVTMAFEP